MNSCLRIFIIVSIGILFYYPARAQNAVVWYENFSEQPCDSLCTVNGYNGNGGQWKDSLLGTQGNYPNEWYVSCAENGNAVGSCGSGCAGRNTLHVGNIAGSPDASKICPTGDCGAIYDPGQGVGHPSTQTRKRALSPVINCTDFKTMTLSFNYMTNGNGGLDKFELYWFDGTTWDSIAPAKTSTNSCPAPHYGAWTKFTTLLPATLDQNPDVKFGFQWQNNSNGSGSDPSVAIDSIELTGTFLLPPIAGFTPSQNNFCENTCINFTDTSTNFPTSWSWNFGGGATPNTSTLENPSNICFNTPGSYPVVLTATNANGSSNDTVNIVVVPCTMPKASFSIEPQPICYGDCIAVTNNSQDATSYNWNFGGAATPNTSTTENPTVCFNTNGNFHILLTASNSNGSDTAGLTVTVNECLSPAFTVDNTISCTNDCISFTDESTGNPTSWKWSFPGATPATSTQQNPSTVCYATPGVYDIKLTVGNGGGSDSLTKTGYITILQSPIGTINKDTSIRLGGSAQLSASGGSSYQWTPPTGLSDSTDTIPNPVATPSITTTYTVTITGVNGCTTQEQVVITVIQPQLVFVPNTFTPNGDGVNDIFKVYTAEPIASGDLRIFDRWGELLYETTDLTQGWDGTYKGKPMSMGVFVYWYHLVLEDGKNLTGKGDVTLLR